MALQIGSALREAGHRLLSRTGAILLVVYGVLLLGYQSLMNTLLVAAYARLGLTEVASVLPLALDVPLAVAAAGVALAMLITSYLSLVAVRTFVAGARDRFPDGATTRNVPLGVVNVVAGGVAYSLLILVGSVLLLLPGLIAYVAFLFMLPYIAVEDRNFLDALRASYRLSKGHWLRLGLLVVTVLGAAGLVGGVTGSVSALLLPVAVGQVLVVLVQIPVSLYTLAVIAVVFERLREPGTTAERDDGPAATPT